MGGFSRGSDTEEEDQDEDLDEEEQETLEPEPAPTRPTEGPRSTAIVLAETEDVEPDEETPREREPMQRVRVPRVERHRPPAKEDEHVALKVFAGGLVGVALGFGIGMAVEKHRKGRR